MLGITGTRGALDEGTAVSIFVDDGEVNGVAGLEGGGAIRDCGSFF